MSKIKLSKQTIAPARGERTGKLRAYVESLKADEAVPLTELMAEFDLKERHTYRIVKEMGGIVTVAIGGRPVVCAANPKTVEKYNAS